ncbi:hypothetical protein [Microtetraspora malaysiensis]|uniref:hypothetical protein n=1 Tax=Microtetraspora malaysiensis TaxID=161358 RepID=UPI000829D2AA|nr:hypothetical protein [Microtetraspora malaysiensis]
MLTRPGARGTGRGARRSAAVLLWALVSVLEVYSLLGPATPNIFACADRPPAARPTVSGQEQRTPVERRCGAPVRETPPQVPASTPTHTP